MRGGGEGRGGGGGEEEVLVAVAHLGVGDYPDVLPPDLHPPVLLRQGGGGRLQHPVTGAGPHLPMDLFILFIYFYFYFLLAALTSPLV